MDTLELRIFTSGVPMVVDRALNGPGFVEGFFREIVKEALGITDAAKNPAHYTLALKPVITHGAGMGAGVRIQLAGLCCHTPQSDMAKYHAAVQRLHEWVKAVIQQALNSDRATQNSVQLLTTAEVSGLVGQAAQHWHSLHHHQHPI